MHPPSMKGGDWCIVCMANLADVHVQCAENHRIYCATCFEELRVIALMSRSAFRCGYCIVPILPTAICCGEVQLEATRTADAFKADSNKLPWEVLENFHADDQGGVDMDDMKNVREAVRKCYAEMPIRRMILLREKLGEIDFEYAFLEHIGHLNLHQVLQQLPFLFSAWSPTTEVSMLGVAGAVLGAFLGPTGADLACPLLAAAGGSLGHFLGKLRNPGSARVGWEFDEQLLHDAQRRLEIDVEVDEFQQARFRFQHRVLTDVANGKDSLATKHLSDWQLLRSCYASCTRHSREQTASQRELRVYINIMRIRGDATEEWKLVRSWFGNAMNAPVCETETQKVEVYTLYL